MKDNTNKTTQRQSFTVSGNYENARNLDLEITDGDVCYVNVGASYKDGDLVLFKCPRGCSDVANPSDHYHAQYFFRLNGAKYKFRLNERYSGNGGRRYREGDERIIIGPVVKVTHKSKNEKKRAQPKGNLMSYSAGFEWPLFGVHFNDDLIVREDGRAIPGQLILVWNTDKTDSYFMRCCLVTKDAVRIAGSGSKDAYDITPDRLIGATVQILHDDCNQKKREALRKRIRRLQDDTDAITNCTEIYKLEKEILALENPEDEEYSKWPDEINA